MYIELYWKKIWQYALLNSFERKTRLSIYIYIYIHIYIYIYWTLLNENTKIRSIEFCWKKNSIEYVCIYICIYIYICICIHIYICIYIGLYWKKIRKRSFEFYWKKNSIEYVYIYWICMYTYIYIYIYIYIEFYWKKIRKYALLNFLCELIPWANWPFDLPFLEKLLRFSMLQSVAVRCSARICATFQEKSREKSTCPQNQYTQNIYLYTYWLFLKSRADSRTATDCNRLQYAATYCNVLQRTATHCNMLQHIATLCDSLQQTAAHILQYTTTHCSTRFLQILRNDMVTGWRKCIGCLKLQVSFWKRATNYGALLWKMTYKEKASYESSPPCS